MAATYSSFMTTRFYNPVFNTALFDGPFRIYFSQSYETTALKIYHLLQTEHNEVWQQAKEWSLKTKEHIFILIYPDIKSAKLVFTNPEALNSEQSLFMQEWDEGMAIGLTQPAQDKDLDFHLEEIEANLKVWLEKQSLPDVQDALLQS